jgi:hypothetical protein
MGPRRFRAHAEKEFHLISVSVRPPAAVFKSTNPSLKLCVSNCAEREKFSVVFSTDSHTTLGRRFFLWNSGGGRHGLSGLPNLDPAGPLGAK